MAHKDLVVLKGMVILETGGTISDIGMVNSTTMDRLDSNGRGREINHHPLRETFILTNVTKICPEPNTAPTESAQQSITS